MAVCSSSPTMGRYPSMVRFVKPTSPSKLSPPSPTKEGLKLMYSTPVPPFAIDAVDRAAEIGSDIVVLPRHYLPDFQFRKVHGYAKPLGEELLEAAKCFPGCTRIAYSPPFLVVVWPELPPKPWPLTFGGVPLFYGTKSRQIPPTHGCVGSSEEIWTDAHHRVELFSHPKDRIKDVAKFLVEDLGIDVRYFGWSGSHWFAEVVSADEGRRLPTRICSIACMWRVFTDRHTNSRVIVPRDGVMDSTTYTPDLRPRVMLASERLSTSGGIPVINAQGRRYVTVAAHGFPPPPADVYHPVHGPHNVIGRLTESLGKDSDIGLMELKDGLSYMCESFEKEELVDLIRSNDLELLETLFLNSPFNGKCEGLVTSVGFNILPGTLATATQYLATNMIYFGNGIDDILPGTCGSAMWTTAKRVSSFFRYYDSVECVAYGPSVDELMVAGFRLESIPSSVRVQV